MNVEQPRISVIIPAYNTQTLLERCVRSVCAQTYPQTDYLPMVLTMMTKRLSSLKNTCWRS